MLRQLTNCEVEMVSGGDGPSEIEQQIMTFFGVTGGIIDSTDGWAQTADFTVFKDYDGNGFYDEVMTSNSMLCPNDWTSCMFIGGIWSEGEDIEAFERPGSGLSSGWVGPRP